MRAAALVVLVAAAGLSAADLPQPLTRGAARAHAFEHSPRLAQARAAAEAASAGEDAERAARLGELTAVASATRYQDAVIVRPMSEDLVAEGLSALPFDRDQSTAGVVAHLPVYTGGRLAAAAEAAAAETAAAAADLAAVRAAVRMVVDARFAAAQALDARVEAAAAWVEALERRAADVERAFAVGRAAAVDVDRVHAAAIGARAELATAVGEREAALADLLEAIGADPLAEVDLEPLPSAPPRLAASPERLRELALAAPEVQAAAARALAGEHDARAVAAARRPQVEALGSWISHGAPSVDERLETWDVGLSVRFSLFDGGARAARARAARARAESGAAAAQQVRAGRLADLAAALARWEAAGERLEHARAAAAAEQRVLAVEQVRYDTGAAPVRDLVDAHADAAAAQAAAAGAMGDVLHAAATLNLIAGEEIVR